MAALPNLDNLKIGLTNYNTPEQCKQFFEIMGLIPTREEVTLARCPEPCNSPMKWENDSSFKIGWRIRCRNSAGNCRRSFNPLKDSFFEKTLLDWDQIFAIGYCFVADGVFSLKTSVEITGVSRVSVSQWWFFMREVCSRWIERNPIKIGGPGVKVCLDGTHLYSAKYHRGRPMTDVWVFGGVQWDGELDAEPKLFAKRIDGGESVLQLLPIVREHVEQGSVVCTDGHAVYPALYRRVGSMSDQNPGPHAWGEHFATNHSTGEFSQHINAQYIDDNGVQRRFHVVHSTNPLEIRWRWLKANILSVREFEDNQGDWIHFVDGYIDRYVYLCRR